MINKTEVYYLDTIPFESKGRLVALGNFDGIHLGHMAIIRKLVKDAKINGLKSCVQIFRGFNKNEGKVITDIDERASILEELGVDEILVIDFSLSFRNKTHEEFEEQILSFIVNAKAIYVGDDYRYGNNALGDTKTLKDYCDKRDIVLKVFPPQEVCGRRASSTWLRELLAKGDVETYQSVTGGRLYKLSGIVSEGKKLGTKLGFPTINLIIPSDKVVPLRGVYVSSVTIGKNVYYGITNIGLRPTVDDDSIDVAETFIFDFDEDIYGARVDVELMSFIREERKFESLDELSSEVEANKKEAKNYFIRSGIIINC